MIISTHEELGELLLHVQSERRLEPGDVVTIFIDALSTELPCTESDTIEYDEYYKQECTKRYYMKLPVGWIRYEATNFQRERDKGAYIREDTEGSEQG